MPVGVPIEGKEPPELKGDPVGHFFRADAGDRELLVAFRTGRKTIDGRRNRS
jgi:hypothetical protein